MNDKILHLSFSPRNYEEDSGIHVSHRLRWQTAKLFVEIKELIAK